MALGPLRLRRVVVALALLAAPLAADNTAQPLPFSQNWSNTGLITINDNWAGVPGIEGFLGQDITTATGTDPQTLLGVSALPNDLDVIANQANPNTLSAGGVAEFQLADPVVALQGSGTADAPYLLIHLNTTGRQAIVVAYNLRDVDGATDNAVQQVALQYRVGSSGNFTNLPLGYVADATTGPSLATLVTPVSVTLPAAADNQALVQLRILTTNAAGSDEWVGIDDLSVTGTPISIPTLSIGDATVTEGNSGTATATFTVSVSPPLLTGDISFDIATADGTAQDDNPPAEDNDYVAKSLLGQTIFAGGSSYTFDVTVNGDTAFEPNETFFVNLTNITATGPSVPNVADSQGQGTITNDDLQTLRIHDVQGNGAASPLLGNTVTVEGVVIGDFQAATELSGFFLEEEDLDYDADPATSEGIFVFCGGCPTAVAEGQRVQVTGVVAEFFGMTEISGSAAGAVVVTEAGNHLAEVTPAPIDLPVASPSIDAFYEPREGMRVTFLDSLVVSEYFEQARYGQIELYDGSRPLQFTATAAPSVAGYAAHLDALAHRRVILDDDDDAQNVYLTQPDGSQFIFHPRANGGLSVGTQGVDFFRGGDLVDGLTGVLHWSFSGFSGTDAWRIRPTAATPAAFTVANPRPATPPAVGGAIRAASVNLLNYFTTIDTTASSSSGPCGPDGLQDCRGADSAAELVRQRERAAIVLCGLDAHVFGLVELENTTPAATITDLLGAVNARCGGAHPYAFVATGGTLGTDAIRVALIYRTGVLAPVGAALVDLDPIHNRPPTAQTFDVVDAANPAFGQRFTAVANHFKSKGCDASATGADADAADGQGCYNGRRTAQAARLLTWLSATVVPAAGDPDVLLLGDFNSYTQENPVTTLAGGGYTDLQDALLGAAAYSYLFDGQLGHLDYALASASLLASVTGVGAWHINADENPLFDYSDEVKDVGEAAFEEKPDGSALVPPRVVFQPATPYRASDHDPVLVGLFQVADLSIAKVDLVDPVTAGANLAYTITVANGGPDVAAAVSWSDSLPAGTTFVALAAPGGWSCSTPAVGAGGIVTCSTPSLAVGSAAFTLTVLVDPAVAAGSVLSNTANATSTTGDPDTGDRSATAATTVGSTASISLTKDAAPNPVVAGTDLTYTLTASNEGPSFAAAAQVSDPLPAGVTFVSLAAPAGWTCATPAPGGGGTVTCTTASLGIGSALFTIVVHVDPALAPPALLGNSATLASSSVDPEPGDNVATTSTPVTSVADLAVTKSAAPSPVAPGDALTYTIALSHAGPSAAQAVTLTDPLPAGTTFVSLAAPAGWTCVTPALGSGGTVTCSRALLLAGSALFTLVVTVDAGAVGSDLVNTATAATTSTDADPSDDAASVTTPVRSPATVTATKTAAGTFIPGSLVTYTIVLANAGPEDQLDNPGDEFTDTLPPELALSGATASAGAVVADLPNGTVTWNGVVPAGGSVTVTIQALLGAGLADGTIVANQGTFVYDADGNGSNETAGVTDDPATGAADDPTEIVVVSAALQEIPTLDAAGLALLALGLAALAARKLRRRRPA